MAVGTLGVPGAQIAASASNHQIKLYDADRLTLVSVLGSHGGQITQIKSRMPFIVMSSSVDGTVKFWDVRSSSGKPEMEFKAPNKKPLLCFDVNTDGRFLAAGTELVGSDSRILFWDLRNNNKLTAEFVESHSDDITTLQFHHSNPMGLLSAGTDGFISTPRRPDGLFNEDEAPITVINTNSSVARAGLFGPNDEYIYCGHDMETFSVWSATEGTPIRDYGDIKQLSQQLGVQLNYQVGCQYDREAQQLFLFAGSNTGDINILGVEPDGLRLHRTLTEEEDFSSDVVRGFEWNPRTGSLISCSENSRLERWSEGQLSPFSSIKPASSMGGSSGGKSSRYSPYSRGTPKSKSPK
ncbi:WD40 repeat-like protein [Ramicandelaber brevisporus]|nr:WD40 repeat-like protein [Ramicandelaber brevisporus]